MGGWWRIFAPVCRRVCRCDRGRGAWRAGEARKRTQIGAEGVIFNILAARRGSPAPFALWHADAERPRHAGSGAHRRARAAPDVEVGGPETAPTGPTPGNPAPRFMTEVGVSAGWTRTFWRTARTDIRSDGTAWARGASPDPGRVAWRAAGGGAQTGTGQAPRSRTAGRSGGLSARRQWRIWRCIRSGRNRPCHVSAVPGRTIAGPVSGASRRSRSPL